jgi:hypothetical protein
MMNRVQQINSMSSTPAEIERRRQRVAIMKAEGRVETDAMRRRRRKAQLEMQNLEEAAERIISQLRSQSPRKPSGRYNDISTTQEQKSPAPEPNTYVSFGVKYDKKAVAAQNAIDSILQSV